MDEDNNKRNAPPRRRMSAADVWLKIVLPTVLTLAVVALALWGAQQSALAEEYKNSTTSMYRRAFTQLCNEMDGMQTALGKLRVISGTRQSVLLLDDVWRLSGSLAGLMGQIPSSHVDTAELASFINRVGDYARSLTKRALAGEKLAGDDAEQLNSLYAKSCELSLELNERLSIGDVPVAVITNDEYFSESDDTYKSTDEVDAFPTLIYDGPFSESAEKRQPRGLEGDEVGEQDALAIAQRLSGAWDMQSQGASDGNIPAWDFSGAFEDGREVDISITKTGGKLLWMMSSASGVSSGVPADDVCERCREAASEWLSSQGYDSMKPTYAQYYAGAALLNFAATQDGVILYNDLIKVWVDVETLDIIGADARNYIFSHTKRELPPPTVSPEEAEAAVSVTLDIQDRALALIPLSPETERLCWEFRGRCEGDEYIVYIDAETGDEAEVFVIINDEYGTLTM